MSHHTPWKIRSGLSEHSSSIEIEDSRGKWVADAKGAHRLCECKGFTVSPGFPTDEEAEANALLIIAAPELLEAAQELLSWPSMSYAGGKSRDVAKAIAKLQEAIKSATEAKP